jgi:hypothetical protein
MNERETLMFLLHLGSGGVDSSEEVAEKIRDIQKEFGVHLECDGVDDPTSFDELLDQL